MNPAQPPTPAELKEWQNEMRKANDQLGSQDQDSLIDIGFKLVTIHQGQLDSLIEARPGLDQIEETLGIISRESVFNLKFLERTTLTSGQATEHTFDIDLMNELLDGSQSDIINRIKDVISRKEFTYIDTHNLSEYRAQVLEWSRYLAKEGFGAMAYPPEYGGQGDIEKYFSVMEVLSYHDLSLVIKFGVQFGLFGMSILFLGTEKHHKKYLKAIGSLNLPGCFAMTETGHGSNVKGIETTATYHHEAKTFTIQTPSRLARKEYIGNAALHGRMATVFAKLIIDGVDYGVNGFLVPLRDQKGNVLEGISIKDCGRKMGLNGVDNGIIYFDQVVIPEENMLDRYASISKAGKFESPISSDNRRFFTM